MSHLKSASSNLLTCKVLSKNKKTSNLGSKIPYLGIFGLQFNKNCYHPRISENIKFHPKQKYITGTKNALFWSLGWNFEKLLSYLYSTPSNLSNGKVLYKS